MMSTAKKPTVGFIGIGIMGEAIAGHILKAGYPLHVYTRTKEKARRLLAAGATWAESPKNLAQHAQVIFTMVGYPADVEEVYLSSDGLLQCAKKGSWLIDLTTSSPELARDIYAAAEVADMHAFDCPVTGGQTGALSGTLTLIAGTTPEKAKPIEDILKTFSSRIFYFGKAGGGQTAKLCNQVSLISCMTGLCDAMALAELSGIDVELMLEVLRSGTGGSNVEGSLSQKMLSSDWAPGFYVEHLKKDIGLALECADELDIALPGADTGFALLDTLCRIGGSRLGTQAYALLYREDEEARKAGLDWSRLDEEPESDTADR